MPSLHITPPTGTRDWGTLDWGTLHLDSKDEWDWFKEHAQEPGGYKRCEISCPPHCDIVPQYNIDTGDTWTYPLTRNVKYLSVITTGRGEPKTEEVWKSEFESLKKVMKHMGPPEKLFTQRSDLEYFSNMDNDVAAMAAWTDTMSDYMEPFRRHICSVKICGPCQSLPYSYEPEYITQEHYLSKNELDYLFQQQEHQKHQEGQPKSSLLNLVRSIAAWAAKPKSKFPQFLCITDATQKEVNEYKGRLDNFAKQHSIWTDAPSMDVRGGNATWKETVSGWLPSYRGDRA